MWIPAMLAFFIYLKVRFKTQKTPLAQVDLRQDSANGRNKTSRLIKKVVDEYIYC